MSRKNIFTPSSSSDGSPEVRVNRKHTQPLLGVTRPERHPSKRLTGDIGSVFRESSERSLRAEDIERRLAEGQTVVLLPASEIEPSFISDRMPGSIEDHENLVESIREHGQQVPILVRPHPTEVGRYQVAFGHRRLRALAELDRPISAIVRDLTDEQLVVAQGQENNERQDLTFIEKARFADRLKEQFSRETAMAALSIYKSDLSNMLSVITRVPGSIIDAVGPAPGVGLKSWVHLADILRDDRLSDKAGEFLQLAESQALESAERFKALIGHLVPPSAKKTLPEILMTSDGQRLGAVTKSKSRLDLSIDRKRAPEFAAFVLERLPALVEEYHASQSADK